MSAAHLFLCSPAAVPSALARGLPRSALFMEGEELGLVHLSLGLGSGLELGSELGSGSGSGSGSGRGRVRVRLRAV